MQTLWGPLCAVLPSPSSLGLMLSHPGPGEATCSFVALRLPPEPTWPGRIATQGKDGMNALPLSELSWWQPVSPTSPFHSCQVGIAMANIILNSLLSKSLIFILLNSCFWNFILFFEAYFFVSSFSLTVFVAVHLIN